MRHKHLIRRWKSPFYAPASEIRNSEGLEGELMVRATSSHHQQDKRIHMEEEFRFYASWFPRKRNFLGNNRSSRTGTTTRRQIKSQGSYLGQKNVPALLNLYPNFWSIFKIRDFKIRRVRREVRTSDQCSTYLNERQQVSL